MHEVTRSESCARVDRGTVADVAGAFYSGESIVVLANREPFRHDRAPEAASSSGARPAGW